MSLSPGARLGSYEITGVIGAGGMGEVYRARDTKLNRDVAIKVLPEVFALDPDRARRFEREAQTLASLNHPHIAQIYGVNEHPPALVMELVDGEDLAQRLARGPLPLDEALAVARQIAEALEAAHEQGIVHRDLKPANVKARPDGTVKVLDFGLAKALSSDPAMPDLAHSPTFTSPAMTQMGVILGTAAYMAPEQARGKAVDRRADIWAFGCVLYEMLAGRRPFRGDELTDTLAAIVRDTPELTALPPATPAAVRALIERCLEKDPRERLRDIGEARIVLSRPVAATRSEPAAPSRKPGVLGIALGVIAGAAAMWAFGWSREPAAPAIASLRQLTEMPGAEIDPDIAPDGRQVLYSAGPALNHHLYALRVGGGRALDLTPGSAGDNVQAAFSPDGDRIAFRSSREGGGIFVMGATGESVRRVTPSGFDPRWSPDGQRLVYSTEGVYDPYSRSSVAELWTVDVESGAATKRWAGDGVQPTWSPHGTRIAFWSNTRGQRDIKTIAAGGGEPVAVTSDIATDWAPEWSPDGRWLYFVSDRGGSPNLWRVAIDEETGAISGAPQAITNGVRALASARFSHDGERLVAGAADRTFELTLSDFDAAHPETGAVRHVIRSGSLGWCSPSHDASWLACTSRTGHEDIVLLRADGSETRRLTDDAFKDRTPNWSPDDKALSFVSTRSGQWEIWGIGADGGGLRPMTNLGADIDGGAWSPDGRQVVAVSSSIRPFGVWLVDPNRLATRGTRFFQWDGAPASVESWSSDGTLLAGVEMNEGGDAIAVRTWDAATGRSLRRIPMPLVKGMSWNAGFVPGTHRLLANAEEGLAIVDAETGQWRIVRRIPAPFQHRLSGDGRTLLIERTGEEADLWLMEFRKP